jgi:hypothetical protein
MGELLDGGEPEDELGQQEAAFFGSVPDRSASE